MQSLQLNQIYNSSILGDETVVLQVLWLMLYLAWVFYLNSNRTILLVLHQRTAEAEVTNLIPHDQPLEISILQCWEIQISASHMKSNLFPGCVSVPQSVTPKRETDAEHVSFRDRSADL